jgi:hypothetical protein
VEPSPGEQHHFYRIESETEIDEILEYNTWVAHICVIHNEDDDSINAQLIADAPLLLAELKRYQLKDCAIIQAEHMRAQVGDNTWHYAMEVWLYPLTQYWEVEDELALIERYISTNRDAWVKHWGEPSEVVRKRGD